ncbi:MAG: hypothetical protein MJ211_08800 [Bacteroidales bacterium]|nr:hypothetical protein [Bacteroidales bacterium]
MKIFQPILEENSIYKISYLAELFNKVPSTDIFVKNPISKSDNFPFECLQDYENQANKELKAKVKNPKIVGFGFNSEIFNDFENSNDIFGAALKSCLKFGFPVSIITSSDEILLHTNILKKLSSLYCCVSIKIPSLDNSILQLMQPGFPLFEQRMEILKKLSQLNIKTGVIISPILPYINDKPEALTRIIEISAQNGANFVMYQKKLELNENSKKYLLSNIKIRFPQFVEQYEEMFLFKNETFGPKFMELSNSFVRTARRCDLSTRPPEYMPPLQLSLF